MIELLIKFSIYFAPVMMILIIVLFFLWYRDKRKARIETVMDMADQIEKARTPQFIAPEIVANFNTGVKSIDPADWEEDNTETPEPVSARVFRTYRSIDRKSWVECDVSLTERSACNYADYIKKANPQEFVRCEDPNGLILFYE